MLIEITSSSPRKPHSLDAGGIASHRPHVLLGKANRLPGARDHQHVVVPARVADADELVALAHLDRDDAVGLQRRVVRLELRLLHDTFLRGEDDVLRFLEVARLDDCAHLLALLERQQVDDRAALRLTRTERQLVHLQAIDLPDAREEEDVVVCRRDEEVLDVVLFLEVHPHDADAAAPLLAVGRDG
jgi:hypothetical protein